MKAYSIRNGEIFEPEVKEERTNKHRKEKEQECNCNRPYEIELTNEEWFCGLSTEEKAKVFANATYSTAETPLTILWGGKEAEQKKWELWLKQPHTTTKE